jgi:hypothetical protein
MTVKPAQNSGIPAQVQEAEANISDGTSNTIMFNKSPKNPFAKDTFEAPQPQSGSVIESINVKYTFMDYTDDDCM